MAVDELLTALGRQKIGIDEGEPVTMLLYSASMLSEALKKAEELRAGGACVQMNRMYARRFDITQILYMSLEGEIKILEVGP